MGSKVILASGSFIRGQLLQQAGIDFSVIKPRIDEDSVKASLLAEGASPRDIADALAELKTMRISAKNPGALVIGCDQVLDLNGHLVSKASTMTEARRQLSALCGQKHHLMSAAVITRDGQPIWRFTGRTTLWMREFSDDFRDLYLKEQGEGVFETLGCYKFEQAGIRLFSKVEGDYFNILGLPLIELMNYLTEIGELQK